MLQCLNISSVLKLNHIRYIRKYKEKWKYCINHGFVSAVLIFNVATSLF